MLNFTNRANPDEVLFNLLKLYNLSFTSETVSQELNTHPDYPSLLALNDVALNFGLHCAAYQISNEDLFDVPCPFIAYSTNQGSEFTLVTKITKDTVAVDLGNGRKKISLTDFKSKFTGTVLVADEVNQNIKSQSKLSLAKLFNSFRYFIAPLLLVLALISGLFLHFNSFNSITLPYVLLLLFKSAGVLVSILLLIQSIDQNNPLIQKLCGGSSKTDCNAILTSKAATVFKELSWSEVGLFYFTGTWLVLMSSHGLTIMLQALAILNIVSLPYTFYSIYYQAKVAKQWCKLCCAVQALLWLEFFSLVLFSPSLFNIGSFAVLSSVLLSTGLNLFICLALPIALWLLLKPLLLKAQQSKSLKSQLRKLKYNKEFFDQLLFVQPKYATPDENWSIVLGNVNAENIITMVSNPYCPPCAKTHQILDEWLDKRDDLQVRLVFTANNSEADIKTPVTRHLMALNAWPEKSMIKRALHDWYGQTQKNYEAWAKVYPVALVESEYYKLDKQSIWCDMAEIKATPTFLINGYRLPELYQLNDIKYLLN
ncbi:cysteine peptidase family C39 domain-containing protein [uncultured Mucilaginibacter sp.]|uniref:cysteine peptidase family C39 domain-containing protein n=1 Tax=uncultured Mucilaginibacter sp. TaxID=797541 RepID=UPI002634DDFD|nr:cysteine peptidase family C39 domain-containing protein [uncultured Mucilaginibacter sp.]